LFGCHKFTLLFFTYTVVGQGIYFKVFDNADCDKLAGHSNPHNELSEWITTATGKFTADSLA